MPTNNQIVRKNIRLPKDAYRSDHPFFITICTHHKHPWFSENSSLQQALTQILKALCSQRRTTLYAWCIMPDHVHLLIRDDDIQSFVRSVKGRLTPVARPIIAGAKLWQRSFYDHAVRNDELLKKTAVYIWNNPVTRKLVSCPSHYTGSGSLVWPDWREWFVGAT